MKYSKMTHRIASAIMAGALASVSSQARAVDLNNVTTNITTSAATLPNGLSVVCYVLGIGMAVAGTLKLRDHTNNPAQIPLREGVGRLMAGATLTAAPFLATSLQNTINAGDNSSQVVQTGFAPVGP